MIICEGMMVGNLGSESAVQTSWPLGTRSCPIVGSMGLHRTRPSVDMAERVPWHDQWHYDTFI
jgi:hypothetical protein